MTIHGNLSGVDNYFHGYKINGWYADRKTIKYVKFFIHTVCLAIV